MGGTWGKMAEMDPSRIGETLKAARARLGWSRETLAHHSGVSWSAIAQIESGRRKDVRLSSLSALAEALCVSVDYLIGTASAAPQLLGHRLFTYGSDEDYLATAIPFLDEGVDRAECLLAVTTEGQAELLRGDLNARAQLVEFVDSAEWYRSPHTAMEGYRSFVNQNLEAGATWIRVVAEIAIMPRSAAEAAAWTRYESFVNVAFASTPATILCTYDERSWPAGVIADARQTHPEIAHGNETSVNPSYREPQDFLINH
jgi:transcriptional regulator with XRE-family HTH domain